MKNISRIVIPFLCTSVHVSSIQSLLALCILFRFSHSLLGAEPTAIPYPSLEEIAPVVAPSTESHFHKEFPFLAAAGRRDCLYSNCEPRWICPRQLPAPCDPTQPQHPYDLIGVMGLATNGPRYTGPCELRSDDPCTPAWKRPFNRFVDCFYRKTTNGFGTSGK